MLGEDEGWLAYTERNSGVLFPLRAVIASMRAAAFGAESEYAPDERGPVPRREVDAVELAAAPERGKPAEEREEREYPENLPAHRLPATAPVHPVVRTCVVWIHHECLVHYANEGHRVHAVAVRRLPLCMLLVISEVIT